jgi:hypothetical protein
MKNFKKKIILVFLVFVVFNSIKSQTWSSGTSSLFVSPTTTNIGIGTSYVQAKLHINAATGQDALRLQIG